MLKWLKLPAREPQTPREYFAHLPTLETPRLVLRRVTMRDAGNLYRWMQDPEVAKNVLWHAHRSIWETRDYLRYMLYQYRQGDPGSWGIVDKATGRVIGTIGYMGYQADHGWAELGYSLSREYWGQGLMTEALQAVLDDAFTTLKLNRAEAMHFPDNPASGRVMEKCGMRHEGTLRGRILCRGELRDAELWAMTVDDYRNAKKETTT